MTWKSHTKTKEKLKRARTTSSDFTFTKANDMETIFWGAFLILEAYNY